MISHATFPLSGSNWAFRKFDLWANADVYSTAPAFTYVLAGPLAGRWRFSRPVTLETSHDEDTFFLFSDELNVYGAGQSYLDAYADLVSMLIEQYEELLASEDILAPGLRHLLDKYRSLLLPL